MSKLKYSVAEVLCLSTAPKYSGTVRGYYRRWRASQGMTERCDTGTCRFHTEPLVWNGQRLPLILDHRSGNRDDNRPENLRLLCPNCDSQNWETRAGANKGRVERLPGGGYHRKNRNGTQDGFAPGAIVAVNVSVLPSAERGKTPAPLSTSEGAAKALLLQRSG